MKRRILVMSFLTIALCFSLIFGATYALFTSESKVNIAVTSGKVEVVAEVADLKTFSMGVEQANGAFENGGKAEFDTESKLNLELLTPGDAATFTVKIENSSNIKIKYRVVLSIEGELASGLVSKAEFNGEEYPLNGGSTKWFSLDANTDIPDVYVSIELPVEAGNDFQNKAASIVVKVEAVQGNAETVDEWNGTVDTAWFAEDAGATEYVLETAEEFAGFAALINGTSKLRAAAETFEGKTIYLESNVDLSGINWTPIGDPMSDNYVGFAGTFDGQGYTISNLNIDNPTAWGQGLFGYNTYKTTTIKNLNINNVYINAEDTSGAVAGYFQFGTIENVNVTGDVKISGAQHMGGLVGNGYYVNFNNCSVIANEGSYIETTGKSQGSFVGGIVGYHGAGTYEITNCTVKNLEISASKGAVGVIAGHAGYGNTITGCTGENVVLNKNGIDSKPSIGLVMGNYTNDQATAVITNNTFKNITLNGTSNAYTPYNIFVGSEYAATENGFTGTLENNVAENITNNLK